MRVLLVEDEATLAGILSRNLHAHGHDVQVCETVEAACSSIETWRPDALIIDVNLPDHSGWEILRRLSPEERGRLRVIVTSAAPISRKRIEEFQPLRALQKPYPIDALLRAIENKVEMESVGE